MKTIHNIETGEIIERELNTEELAQQTIDEAFWLEKQAAHEAAVAAQSALKASAKAKLISGTPLTEEEAATIVF